MGVKVVKESDIVRILKKHDDLGAVEIWEEISAVEKTSRFNISLASICWNLDSMTRKGMVGYREREKSSSRLDRLEYYLIKK